LTRILRSSYLVKLENLLDLKIKIERVNSIELKLDSTITLTRNIVKLELVYYSNYNLLIYSRAIILFSLKVIVKLKDKSLDFSLNLLSKNKLLDIKKIVQILVTTNSIIYFR